MKLATLPDRTIARTLASIVRGAEVHRRSLQAMQLRGLVDDDDTLTPKGLLWLSDFVYDALEGELPSIEVREQYEEIRSALGRIERGMP